MTCKAVDECVYYDWDMKTQKISSLGYEVASQPQHLVTYSVAKQLQSLYCHSYCNFKTGCTVKNCNSLE